MNSNLKRTIYSLSLLLTTILFFSCASEDDFEANKKVAITIDLSGEITQYVPNSLVIDETNPSNKYIRIDSSIVYGFGAVFILPDSLKDSDLKIIASGKMRESNSMLGSVAITLMDNKDSTLFWDALTSTRYVKELNSWASFKDSVVILRGVNNINAKTLKMFPFKNRGSGFFDVDDLKIEIIKE